MKRQKKEGSEKTSLAVMMLCLRHQLCMQIKLASLEGPLSTGTGGFWEAAFTDPDTGSNGHPGSHRYIPASFHASACFLTLSFLCLSWFQLGCSRYVCSLQTFSICFVLFFCLSVCLNKMHQHRPTWLNYGCQSKVVFKRKWSIAFKPINDGGPAKNALDTHASLTHGTETGASQISQ